MFIATEEFVSAAVAQSASLGFPTVARVYTPHPVQDRTDDEMRVLEAAAAEKEAKSKGTGSAESA